MSDYISREAALDVVNGWRDQLIPTYGKNDEYVKCLETVAEHLESLPTADVRPVRRGKWNIVKLPPDPGYKAKECSACKCNFWDLEEWNFCPNCGADMKAEEGE